MAAQGSTHGQLHSGEQSSIEGQTPTRETVSGVLESVSVQAPW